MCVAEIKCRELGFRPRSVQFGWMDVDGSLEYQLCVCSMCPRSYSILRYWRLRNPVRHCQHTARINCSQKRTLEKGVLHPQQSNSSGCMDHYHMSASQLAHCELAPLCWTHSDAPAEESAWTDLVASCGTCLLVSFCETLTCCCGKVRNPLVQTHHGSKHWNNFNIESVWS